jgi:hypothetical protein
LANHQLIGSRVNVVDTTIVLFLLLCEMVQNVVENTNDVVCTRRSFVLLELEHHLRSLVDNIGVEFHAFLDKV